MNMNQIQISAQRLLRNILLNDSDHLDTNSNTVICETLDFLNQYIEAINNHDTETLQEFKERRDTIIQSVVLYEVLKMVYDPKRLNIESVCIKN